MSESVFLESSHSFVDKLLDLDNEMKAKMCGKGKSADEIYQMYFDILSLYEKSSILPLNESDKLLLQDKKEQLDDIQSKLEDLKKNM